MHLLASMVRQTHPELRMTVDRVLLGLIGYPSVKCSGHTCQTTPSKVACERMAEKGAIREVKAWSGD